MSNNTMTPKTLKAYFALRPKGLNLLFLFTVVIPTCLSLLFYGFIASDVYISESKFVVRTPERQSASPLGVILKGSGFIKTQDDSYTVQDYILSRDALKALDEKLRIKEAYSRSDIDIFSRFAGLHWDDSFEALNLYYIKKVVVRHDSASSITNLTVSAFTANEAYAINRLLLELSEGLVNQINERGRQDMIRFAAKEVADAEKNAKNAAFALAQYRNKEGVIDPEKQSAIHLQQIAKLQDELIATKSQIAQLEHLAKENPQLPVLRERSKLLQQEIQAETFRVAGGGDRSLADKAADYHRFVLEKEFADKMLASAMSTLEQARNEAQRKQIYIERIAQPSIPDEAMEPKRLRNIIATLIIGLIAWGVLSMLIAGIKEHRD